MLMISLNTSAQLINVDQLKHSYNWSPTYPRLPRTTATHPTRCRGGGMEILQAPPPWMGGLDRPQGPSFGGSRPPGPGPKSGSEAPQTPPPPGTPFSQGVPPEGGGGVGPLYLFRLYGALLHESLWAFGQAKKRVFW